MTVIEGLKSSNLATRIQNLLVLGLERDICLAIYSTR